MVLFMQCSESVILFDREKEQWQHYWQQWQGVSRCILIGAGQTWEESKVYNGLYSLA
jgi:hypothetical protein